MNNLAVINNLRLDPEKAEKRTYKFAIKAFNRFLDTYQGDTSIIDFFKELKKTKSISTQKTYFYAIKKTIEQKLRESGHDNGFNLFRLNEELKKIKLGQTQKAVDKSKCLDREELKQVTLLAGEKTSLIIRALYDTAARREELRNIKFSDCFITEKGVSIQITGKGQKQDFVFMGIDLFNQIKETYQGTKYLFESKINPGQPVSATNLYNLIKGAGKKINRSDIHPHSIRHTFATLNIEKLGLAKTSAYLRHTKETTTTMYLHGKPDMDTILNITGI